MINILLLHMAKITNILKVSMEGVSMVAIQKKPIHRMWVTIGCYLIFISRPHIIQMTTENKHWYGPRISIISNRVTLTDKQTSWNPTDKGDIAPD
jgi:hypothetical protein